MGKELYEGGWNGELKGGGAGCVEWGGEEGCRSRILQCWDSAGWNGVGEIYTSFN